MINGIATITIVIIAWHLLWLMRFRNTLPDTDYGHFAYYGYFAVRSRDRRILTGLPVWVGFKPGVYYLMATAFAILGSWNSPRVFFALWNSLAALILYVAFPQGGILAVLLYLTLSTAPYLGACYLQGEFWALLPTAMLIALSLASEFKGSGVLFGFLLLVNPVAFKITYVFESLVFMFFYDGQRLEMVVGIFLFALVVTAGLVKTRVLAGTLQAIRSFNILTYFLRYGRTAKINPRSLLTFRRELAAQLIGLPLLAVFADPFLGFLIAAALLGAFVQFRFYRYHFVTLIPAMTALAAQAQGPLLWLAVITPILFTIPYWMATSLSQLDECINQVIVHYHKRNVASRHLADWIKANSKPADKILAVGDTPQLHILADRMSSNYYLDFDPNAVDAAPELAERLIIETIDHPPEYMVMLIDCLNWDYFEARTGLKYAKVHVVLEGDEAFPVYRKSGASAPARKVAGKLFHGCRFISPSGSKIWNKIITPASRRANGSDNR